MLFHTTNYVFYFLIKKLKQKVFFVHVCLIKSDWCDPLFSGLRSPVDKRYPTETSPHISLVSFSKVTHWNVMRKENMRNPRFKKHCSRTYLFHSFNPQISFQPSSTLFFCPFFFSFVYCDTLLLFVECIGLPLWFFSLTISSIISFNSPSCRIIWPIHLFWFLTILFHNSNFSDIFFQYFFIGHSIHPAYF